MKSGQGVQGQKHRGEREKRDPEYALKGGGEKRNSLKGNFTQRWRMGDTGGNPRGKTNIEERVACVCKEKKKGGGEGAISRKRQKFLAIEGRGEGI